MTRTTLTALLIAAITLIWPSGVAVAACYPAGSSWSAYHNLSGGTFSCNFTLFHGNYGTVGFSQNDAAGYGTNATPCTSVSMQVVASAGSGLVNGPKLTDSTWGNGADRTSSVGAGYLIFGSNWWANRTGVYSVLYQDTAFGC